MTDSAEKAYRDALARQGYQVALERYTVAVGESASYYARFSAGKEEPDEYFDQARYDKLKTEEEDYRAALDAAVRTLMVASLQMGNEHLSRVQGERIVQALLKGEKP